MAFRLPGLPAGRRRLDVTCRLQGPQGCSQPPGCPLGWPSPCQRWGPCGTMGGFAAVGKYCLHPKTLCASHLFPFAQGDWFTGREFQKGKNEEKIVFISSTKEPEDLSHSETSD